MSDVFLHTSHYIVTEAGDNVILAGINVYFFPAVKSELPLASSINTITGLVNLAE